MKVELLSLYLQYDWSRHRESNSNCGIESPVSLPFRRWRDIKAVVFLGATARPAYSGGVSSPLEYVDTIINITPYLRPIMIISFSVQISFNPEYATWRLYTVFLAEVGLEPTSSGSYSSSQSGIICFSIV